MKKKWIMIMVLLLVLAGCGKNSEEPSDTPEPEEPTQENVNIDNDDDEVIDDDEVVYKEEFVVVDEDELPEGMQHFQGVTEVETGYEIDAVVKIEDGEVVAYKNGEEADRLPGVNDAKSLAWYINIGGTCYFAVVREDGSAATFMLHLEYNAETDEKPTVSISDIAEHEADGKIESVMVYEAEDEPLYKFYYVLEDGTIGEFVTVVDN